MDNWLRFQYHRKSIKSEVGTQKDKQSTRMVERVQIVRLKRRQIRALKGWAMMRREKEYRKLLISYCQEKPLARP